MQNIYAILAVAVFIAISYFWAILVDKLLRYLKTTPPEPSNFEQEKFRSKRFYRHIFSAFIAEVVAFVLVLGILIGAYYTFTEELPFFVLPVILFAVLGVVIFVLFHVFFIRIAHKYDIQNYDSWKKKLARIDSWDMGILGLSLFMGYMHSAVLANVVYFIMLLAS